MVCCVMNESLRGVASWFCFERGHMHFCEIRTLGCQILVSRLQADSWRGVLPGGALDRIPVTGGMDPLVLHIKALLSRNWTGDCRPT